ncbi:MULTISPECIES: heme-binding protein [Sulfolobaceae]|uniref:GlcG/HbpS family heme-binding protein n=1 Tax=Sulfolobaceae TaxID=118883 RepID=UPI001E4B33AF|nr:MULTISPECIES: heme-binding protein [unclassified Sulfolobus]
MKTTFTKESISDDMAMVMIKAATEKAKEIGKSFVIAIVDESGVLKSFLRMDGAPLLSVQVAIDKAYTAVGFGMPTHQWYDFIKNDPPLALGAPSGINRLIIFGGGYPIVLNGKIVGGIGVSGGHYTEDMKVAEAALEALKKEVERSG